MDEKKSLSEMDLHCIANHINELIDIVWKEEKDAQASCYHCIYSGDCINKYGCLDPWKAFFKLSDITGVYINPFKKFNKDKMGHLK